MRTLSLVLLSAMLCSGMPQKEKSEGMKRIDEQIAMINLLVTNREEWCASLNRISGITELCTTNEDKTYGMKRGTEIYKILFSQSKKLVDIS